MKLAAPAAIPERAEESRRNLFSVLRKVKSFLTLPQRIGDRQVFVQRGDSRSSSSLLTISGGAMTKWLTQAWIETPCASSCGDLSTTSGLLQPCRAWC